MWEKRRLLVWGKTYPEFSSKYYETVCTGAVDETTRKLVRIYPISLRYMEEPFKAYDWIEAEVERNSTDPRPESHHIQQDSIKVVGRLDTKDGWAERSKWVLSPGNVFQSVRELVEAEKSVGTSLGLVKPKEVIRFYVEKRPETERAEWDQKREHALSQRDLFVDADTKTKDLKYMPIRFRTEFVCDDTACQTKHNMAILDWGVYALSRKQYAKYNAQRAQDDVIDKLREYMDPARKQGYFFFGNTNAHPQSFSIVGLYHPPLPSTKAASPQTGWDF